MWSESIPCAVPIHGVHVVRASHHARYQFMLSTWSVCVTIYCPCPSVSHILPLFECITMRGINSWCPCGQYVSHISPCAVSIHGVNAVPIHGVHVVRVDPIYCPCGRSVSPCAVSIHGVHMVRWIPYIVHVVRVYHHAPYRSMLSRWSDWITICRINSCCLHGQKVSHILPMWSVRLTMRHIDSWYPCGHSVSHILPIWSERIQYIAHMVRVSHHAPYRSMMSTWSESIPYGQSVSHMVRASHHARYQFMVSTWSECLVICRTNSRCLCGQSASPCAVSVHGVHVVRVYPIYCPYCQSVSDILPMWSECPRGHHILSMWSEWIPYIAHVVRVSHHARYQFIVSTWSPWITIYCPRCQSVSHICPCCQSVSPCAVLIYGVHVVRVSHHALYQFMVAIVSHHILSTWSMCLTIYCVNPYRIDSDCPT